MSAQPTIDAEQFVTAVTPMLAEQNLDATFAALWADPECNIAEAERDRRSDAEIDAGAGFRGSIDDLLVAIDG